MRKDPKTETMLAAWLALKGPCDGTINSVYIAQLAENMCSRARALRRIYERFCNEDMRDETRKRLERAVWRHKNHIAHDLDIATRPSGEHRGPYRVRFSADPRGASASIYANDGQDPSAGSALFIIS